MQPLAMTKRLLIAVGLLFCAVPCWAQCSNTSYGNGFTCVQQVGTRNNNGSASSPLTATLGANTVSGHQVEALLFFCTTSGCVGGATPTITFTDGASDAVSVPTTACSSVNSQYSFCAAIFPNVSATNTVSASWTGTISYPALYISEWTGGATSNPFDGDAIYCGASSGTSLTCSKTTTATDLVTGFAIVANNPSITAGTGFTQIGQDIAGDQDEGETGAANTYSVAWSWTGSNASGGIAVAMKKLAAPAPVGMSVNGPASVQ